MGIFEKTVDEYTYKDIEALLGVVESTILEFKMALDPSDPWNDLVKELVSFANAYGGYLVLGAEADKSRKLVGLPGIDGIDSFEQRIIDLCLTRVSPAYTPFPSAAISIPQSEKVLYAIHAPASLIGPHFLLGRKGAYIRVSEHDKPYEPKLAEWEELTYLADRRERALRLRTALLDRAMRRASVKMPSNVPFVDVFITPAYPVRPLLEVGRLPSVSEASKVAARGTRFPPGDLLTLHESAAYTPHEERPQDFYVEVTIYGSVFARLNAALMFEKAEIVPLDLVLSNVILWPNYARRILRNSGYQGPIFVSAALRRIRNRAFVWRGEDWFSGFSHVPRFDDDAVHEIDTDTQRLQDDLKGLALDLFLPMAYACGFEPLLRANRDDLVIRAIEYLNWTLADMAANR